MSRNSTSTAATIERRDTNDMLLTSTVSRRKAVHATAKHLSALVMTVMSVRNKVRVTIC